MTVLTLAGKPINWAKPPAQTTRVKWSKKDKSGRAITGSFRTICHLEYTDQQARKEFGVGISIFQPPYNKGYKPSAGTHDYDACIDAEIPGVGWTAQGNFFKRLGWGGWIRTPKQGFIYHFHGFSLPPQEGVVRSDDWAILGFTVGKYIDGGWSLYGRKVASAQIDAYYANPPRDGLKSNAIDKSWHPPNIKATIFDLSAFIRTQRDPAKPQPTDPNKRKAHTVKRGDTLSAIAAKYKVTVKQLQTWNKVKNPNVIEVGDVLYVSP